MKILHYLTFIIFFISCSQQEIKLPLNDNPGKHEIWNNSPIYILTKIKGNDTIPDLKMGKIITTTHWLVAIDRRLKLKNLIEPIEKIIKKRHKKSIHYDPTKKLYFSYSDTLQKKVSFVNFDSIQFMPEIYTSKKYFKKYFNEDKDYNKFHLIIDKQKIVLNDSIILKANVSKTNLKEQIWKYVAGKTDEKQNLLYLNFDNTLDFNTFMNYYSFFMNNPIPKGKLSHRIFIFDDNIK